MARKRKYFKNDEEFKNQLRIDDIYSIKYKKMNVVAIVLGFNQHDINFKCIMCSHLDWIEIGSNFKWSLHNDGEKITKL